MSLKKKPGITTTSKGSDGNDDRASKIVPHPTMSGLSLKVDHAELMLKWNAQALWASVVPPLVPSTWFSVQWLRFLFLLLINVAQNQANCHQVKVFRTPIIGLVTVVLI